MHRYVSKPTVRCLLKQLMSSMKTKESLSVCKRMGGLWLAAGARDEARENIQQFFSCKRGV